MPVYSPFLNLLVQCGLATILLCGAVLARRQRFRTHGWVQSTVVLVNLAAILGFMLPSFSRQVAPHWRITLHGGGDWIVVAHAAVGATAELLAIYVILVAGSSLLPERYRFSRYKPWMRTTLALWMLALLLGFATYRVCYAQAATPPAAGQGSQEVVVTIDNFKFDPKEVKVKAGTVVTWTDSGGRHTVTSDDGAFDSGTLTAGGSYQHKFEKPGVYPYHCMFHGERGGKDMAGVVTVEATTR
jgi:plastocyanin